jgi:hypothetical protein
MPGITRPSRWGGCWQGMAAILFAAVAAAQESGPTTGKPPVSPEQMQVWVDQLDADEFLTRETAMLRLLGAGRGAIPVLKTALGTENLETISRGLYVLEQLGLSPDLDVQEEARQALADLSAAREHAVTSRRAAVALDHLIELRSAQALADLESLGAKVTRGEIFNGFATEEVVEALQIGPEFKGSLAELRRLKWLSISRLVLVGERVTDEWVAQAAPMTELDELHIYEAKIGDAALAPFADHPRLSQVGIYYTPVSEAALTHLKKLPVLNFVKLFGTKITRGSMDEFVQANAQLVVDHRRGAFLGVGCQPVDNTCMLTTVHVGSPAEKAGLMPDDMLQTFHGSKVSDFKTLTALISELNVGDTVDVEVQRQVEDAGGDVRMKTIVAKVTFGPWPVEVAVRNAPPQ